MMLFFLAQSTQSAAPASQGQGLGFLILGLIATLIAAVAYLLGQRAKARSVSKCPACNTPTPGAYCPRCGTKMPPP